MQARLLAVGVLKLVHQDVVELAPQALAGLGVVFQQADRELFEIGEIERAGLRACARDRGGRSGAGSRSAARAAARSAR